MKLNKRLFSIALWLMFAAAGSVLCVLSGLYLYLSPELPAIDSLRDVKLQTPLRIYTADGDLIAEFGERRRSPVKFDEIPQQYIDALLAAEDNEFFEHSGVSLKGILRAATQLILTGERGQGGSTITMQIPRNYEFLSRRKTFARKFNEILLAFRIEKELTKEEILELYVNVIFLGNRAYGIKAASQVYYGKSLHQLSLAQIAMIAGLPKGPSIMNPIVNPPRALARRNWILGRMLELNKITDEQYNQAVLEPVSAEYHRSINDVDAPYVAEMARAKAIGLFGLKAYTEGYSLYTTVNGEFQNSAKQAVVDGLLTYDSRHGYRGPELQLELSSSTVLQVRPETEAPESDAPGADSEDSLPTPLFSQVPEETLLQWHKSLADIPAYGDLLPAAVVTLDEQSFTATLADGSLRKVEWEQGISAARRYINENTRGPSPTTASDVVALGDVVRLKQTPDNNWQLSQVPEAQATLVALNPENGAILSLVGGFDFSQSHFNRATQAKRQPGSNFKPFVYTAALENGMTPATIINDAPIVFDDAKLESTWRPENDGGRFDGPTRLRKALYRSRNLVSIRILQEIGIGNAISGMNRFGFNEKDLPRDLTLALGSLSLTPLEVVTGYAVFANGGYQVEPYLTQRIVDTDGRVVFEAQPRTVCRDCDAEIENENLQSPLRVESNSPSSAQAEEPEPLPTASLNGPYIETFELTGDPFALSFHIKSLLGTLEPADYPRAPKVLDDRIAYIMDSILKDVIQRGTGVRAKVLGRTDLGGKTGTTNGPIDAWFSGYSASVAATTWVGFDANTELGKREYGGSAALPIWIDFMRTALANTPEYKRPQPAGLVTVRIDPETGDRARSDDPDAIFEIFRSENVPELKDAPTQQASPYGAEEILTEELF
ncbi:penicillin-binding protein 1A [Teredinibacter waterburyi]|uniref:penicillin-binding protein 1A n=1 Tax=Teredinibacter waterburyi TaxID=1500538 RepID=UPI00165F8AF0|nr:penicillin-binding protein 1A [Teredinibacter waterburyi]